MSGVMKHFLMQMASGAFDPVGDYYAGKRRREQDALEKQKFDLDSAYKTGMLKETAAENASQQQWRGVTATSGAMNALASKKRADIAQSLHDSRYQDWREKNRLALGLAAANKLPDATAVAGSLSPNETIDPSLVAENDAAGRARQLDIYGKKARTMGNERIRAGNATASHRAGLVNNQQKLNVKEYQELAQQEFRVEKAIGDHLAKNGMNMLGVATPEAEAAVAPLRAYLEELKARRTALEASMGGEATLPQVQQQPQQGQPQPAQVDPELDALLNEETW